MDRQFSEPFIFLGEDEAKLPLLKEKAQLNEIKILKGGRFYHFVGINQDKGNAIKIMQKHLEELMGDKYISIGIGDSQNDVDMFKVVDIPILVKKFDGSFENINDDYEIIVIDDGSTDNTYINVKSKITDFKNKVVVERYSPNKGQGLCE